MNKKEILEKSRKENNGKLDEREIQIYANSSKIGMAIGGMLSIIIVIYSRIFEKGENTNKTLTFVWYNRGV